MRFPILATLCVNALLANAAHAQRALVVRDLDALSPTTLTRETLVELLPGAKISRTFENGNFHVWFNDPDGTFVVASDRRGVGGGAGTGNGKWHISEDGRYCILIEWPRGYAEDWCRFVVKTNQGYYTTRSLKVGTERVYKFSIEK